MPAHDDYPLFKPRLGQQLPCSQVMKCMLKNPGIVKGATSDAHAGAAGFVNHLAGSFSGDDVTVPDDRNRLDCLHDGTDSGQVHDAAKALLAGATMDENRR